MLKTPSISVMSCLFCTSAAAATEGTEEAMPKVAKRKKSAKKRAKNMAVTEEEVVTSSSGYRGLSNFRDKLSELLYAEFRNFMLQCFVVRGPDIDNLAQYGYRQVVALNASLKFWLISEES